LHLLDMADIVSSQDGFELVRSRGDSRTREDTITEPEQKEVIKSLLDQFLEVTADEDAVNELANDSGHMTQKLLEEVESFVVQVGKCYQGYGCPTHTNELNLVSVAKGLGVDAQVLVFPSHIFVQVDNIKTEIGITKRHSQFFRTSSGFNFYKLQLVDELVRRISSYAQDSQETAQTIEIKPAAVDEAFQRARAYSTAVASGSTLPNDPTPPPPEGALSDLIASTNNHSNADGFMSINSSCVNTPTGSEKVYTSPVNKAHTSPSSETRNGVHAPSPTPLTPKPAFHMLLPRLSRRLSAKNNASGQQNQNHVVRNKLARLILTLATLGPNVYTVHGDEGAEEDGRNNKTNRTYRNLFAKLAVEDGVRLIRAIIKQRPLYSIWFKVFLTGASSFGSCGIFFGGSWLDCALSFALGVLIALIELFSIVSPTFSRIYEFVATFVTSILIRAAAAHYPHFCYRAVLLSTIVFMLQGATITLAFVDIMTKDIITGTTRLFFGMLISALIGYAMDISTSTYATFADRPYDSVVEDSVCGQGIDPNWYPLMFIIMSLGFNILLEAHRNQLPPMVIISACTYIVYYYLTKVIDNQFPTILAAFTASLLSNLYSRRTGQPAVVYIIPAIFLLVPGSVAASSFYTVLILDLRGGMELTFAVVTGALSIAIGIFAASVLVPVPDIEEYFRKAYASFPGPHSKRDTQLARREKDFNSGLKF